MPGRSVGGGGLRAWGLGEALKGRGHDVVYSVPEVLVPEGAEHDELRKYAFDPADLQRAVLRAEPDVLIVEQWGLATYLQDVTIPVVLDLHGSLILENAFRKHRTLTSNAAAKIKALQKADLVLCPAVRQRAYFMSWLMMSGADPRDIPIEVVPVSMPPELPERNASAEGPLELVYGGQLWPWIHPDAALQVATELLEESNAGALHLFVKDPERSEVLPHDNSTQVNARALSARILESAAVKVEGLVPHETMIERYSGAHLAVDLYARNSERELAYTTRTVEYLWCGLPVLYGDYGELSDLIVRYEAGWVVSPDDEEGIRAALQEALGDRQELARRSENARRLVQEELTWDKTIDPLDRFITDPAIRERGSTIFGKLALEFDRIAAETNHHVTGLEVETQRLARELEVREARITSLSDELARQDRRFSKQVDRHGRETADRDRELRRHEALLAQERGQVEAQSQELESAREMLQAEQDGHSQTSSRSEQTRRELRQVRQELAQKDEELGKLRTDLNGAVEKINTQAAAAEHRVEQLEQRLKQQAEAALESRGELAAEAAQAEGLRSDVGRVTKENERLQRRIGELRQSIEQLKDDWLQRGVATGQHSWRRVASQVPTLAGLFVRNLANNAYMTVWQKRNKVRIFPGQ
jgi:glycosyltransferase involved in cell wall biosynthesis